MSRTRTKAPPAIEDELGSWQAVAARGYHDPLFFGRRIAGYEQLTGRIHGDVLRGLQANCFAGIYLPREHLKTSCVTHAYITWLIMKHPDIRILLGRESYKEGRKDIQVVRDHLERNEVFRHCYGEYVRRGGRWGDDHFTVHQRKAPYHEHTLQLAAPEHYPTGSHFNVILMDDVVGLRSRYSAATRAKDRQFYKAVWPMLLPDGQFIDMGTSWHTHDAHHTEVLGVPSERIRRREDFWVRLRGAILPDGSIYFPERFTMERLNMLKQGMGPALFSSQMMNVPQAEGLKRFDVDRFHLMPFSRFPAAGRRAGYLDPATGEAVDKGDYTALVLGTGAERKLFVTGAVMSQGPFEQSTPAVLQALKDHMTRTLYVEANAFQTFFARALEEAIRKAGLKVAVHKIKQSRNKQERIDATEPMIYSGQIVFRDDWDVAYPTLISQLGEFPGGSHDDGPDALEGLATAILGRRGGGLIYFPPTP